MEALDELCPDHGISASQIVANLQSGFPWHEPNTIREANRATDVWWQVLNSIFLEACCGLSLTDLHREILYSHVRSKYVNPNHWVLFPDVLPCVADFSQRGWRHVMLPDHVPELREIVSALGLNPYFQAIFNSAETGIEKPHP